MASKKLTNHIPLIHIENEANLDEAIKVINELIDRKSITENERKYLNVLVTLVKQVDGLMKSIKKYETEINKNL